MTIKINYNNNFIKENENSFNIKFFIKETDNGNEHKLDLNIDKNDIYSLYQQDITEENIINDWISLLFVYNKTSDLDFFTLLCTDSYVDIYNKFIFNIPAVGGYSIILTYNEDESFHSINSLIQADY
jgi:hypothetical protein